jgi:hypothetical protein
MAESDWAYWDDMSDLASVRHGVSTGFLKPNGGGDFCYAHAALVSEATVAGRRVALANFEPIATGKGASVRCALYRDAAASHSCYIAVLAQGPSVDDEAYLLGLEGVEPGRIVIRKATIRSGLPSGGVVLAASNLRFTGGSYLHLRLDAIVNANGDVVLNALQNNLTANPVTAPVWEKIAGMGDPPNGTPSFIDDCLGINSGSLPFTGGGYVGFAYAASTIGRKGLVDHFEALRMT